MKLLQAIERKVAAPVMVQLGVDFPQFRALLETSLRVDFRGSAQAVGMRQQTSPLLTALAIYAIYSLMLSFLAFVFPAELYARIILVFGMVILGMVMLIDFGVTLVVPDDIGIVGWRPVSSRSYFAARLTNALFYIVLFSLALHLIPSAFGIFSRGSSGLFPLVFLPSALLGSLFIAGVVAASYAALLRLFRQERFRDVVNYFQILLMILFVVGSQLFPRLEGSGFRERIGSQVALNRTVQGAAGAAWSWWDVFPPRWFVAPMEMLLDGPSTRTVLLSMIAVLSTAALFVALVRTFSLSYLESIGQALNHDGSGQAGAAAPERIERRARPSRFGSLVRSLFRSHEERALFDFTRKLLARDRQVRLRLYPMLTYVLLPALPLLLEREWGSPSSPFGGDSAFAVFLPLFTLGMLPAVLLSFLPYSGESKGEWIFELTGFEKPSRVAAAIKKGLILIFFLPLTFVMVAFFAFFWGLAAAVAVTFFSLVCGLLLLEIEFWLFFRGLPFTRPMTSGRSSVGLGYVLVTFPLIGIFAALAHFFLKTPREVVVAGVILLPLILLLHRLSNARYSPEIRQPAEDGPVKLFS